MTAETDTLTLLADQEHSPFLRRLQAVTQPAAGADWTITVPGDKIWRVLSIVGKLVTSAAAATREATLQITDQSTTFMFIPAGTSQVASKTGQYCWFEQAQNRGTTLQTAITAPIPSNLVLPGGMVLKSVTEVIDAGDQWSNVALWIEEGFIGDSAWGQARRHSLREFASGKYPEALEAK
jgi:hypothetical protein